MLLWSLDILKFNCKGLQMVKAHGKI